MRKSAVEIYIFCSFVSCANFSFYSVNRKNVDKLQHCKMCEKMIRLLIKLEFVGSICILCKNLIIKRGRRQQSRAESRAEGRAEQKAEQRAEQRADSRAGSKVESRAERRVQSREQSRE